LGWAAGLDLQRIDFCRARRGKPASRALYAGIDRSLPCRVRIKGLATDAATLAALKAKLARQRKVAPLFDTARFTRNLESAFATMRDHAAKGEAPRSFDVGESAS
jgi:hypothetical protein